MIILEEAGLLLVVEDGRQVIALEDDGLAFVESLQVSVVHSTDERSVGLEHTEIMVVEVTAEPFVISVGEQGPRGLQGEQGETGPSGEASFDGLAEGDETLPEAFLVKQNGEWVYVSFENMAAWFTAAPEGAVTVNGAVVTVIGETVVME